MVKTKSPEKYKNHELKGGVKGLLSLKAKRVQIFDNGITFINVKKGDQTAFRDKDGYHELSRDNQGRYSLRDLNGKTPNGESA